MKIVGLAGSMRKEGCTAALVNRVVAEVSSLEPGVVSEIISISDLSVQPCRVVCSKYCSTHPYQCSVADDVPAVLRRMEQADGLVIGAPLYFRAPPAKFQALIERLISIFFFYESAGGAEPSPLRGKPCGLVGVAEYSNPHIILEYLHDFCTVLKMKPVLLESFPYLGVAGQGQIAEDAVFHPFERAGELAGVMLREVKARSEAGN